MDTPGYDPPCTTGLIAGGANVLVFTTGRGSVLGLKPTPCIKVATNTPMYERMIDDMDLDAGPILEGEPVESVGRRLFELILDVASGDADQERAAGRRRGGVRAMDHRADPVKPVDPPVPGRTDGRRGELGASSVGWSVLAIAELALAGLVPDRPAAERQQHRGVPGTSCPPGLARAQGVPRGRARHAVPGVVAGQAASWS